MPKFLFYTGTAFCLFVALSSAAGAFGAATAQPTAFLAAGGKSPAHGAAAILVALVAGIAVGAIFLRMAALVAARNLFGAFVALCGVAASMTALVWVVMLQTRMLAAPAGGSLVDLHLASALMLGYFVSLTFLAMRPYFRIQASRTLSALVFLPLPSMLVIVAQELFVARSKGPLPGPTPALFVFFAITSLLFFAIAVHCVRHRYLFLEMTNLRELLDSRGDVRDRPAGRPIGGVAFDS